MKRNRIIGFTLVELMITIAIVAVLAAVAVPAYKKYLIRSRVSEVYTVAIRPIRKAVVTFYSRYGILPNRFACTLSQYTASPTCKLLDNANPINSPYVDSVLLHGAGAINVGTAAVLSLDKTAVGLSSAEGYKIYMGWWLDDGRVEFNCLPTSVDGLPSEYMISSCH